MYKQKGQFSLLSIVLFFLNTHTWGDQNMTERWSDKYTYKQYKHAEIGW